MIQKIKVKPTEIEELFSLLNKNWKRQIMYKWQWGEEHSEPDPRDVYNLEQFEEYSEGGSIIFRKEGKFLIEKQRGSFKNVLTNMKPPIKEKYIYNPKQEIKKLTIENLI